MKQRPTTTTTIDRREKREVKEATLTICDEVDGNNAGGQNCVVNV